MNPFLTNDNPFKTSSNDKPKPVSIYEKPLGQTSFGTTHTHIKNTSNIFSPFSQNIFQNNNNNNEYNPFATNTNTKNNKTSENRTIIIKEQSNPDNTKIVQTTKTYIIDGDNINKDEINEKLNHKLFQGNNMTNDKNEFIEGEDATEIIEKRIPGSKSTTTTTKTTATTTTTTITKIISDGKTLTKTEKVTKVEKGGHNNIDNDNEGDLFSKKIETIPSSSTKIIINSNNMENNENSKKRLFQNIISCDNYEDNSDGQNMNDSNDVKNTFEYQVITAENGIENEDEYIDNNDNENDNDINTNININNHINFTATNNNNNNNNPVTVSFGGINFGAPKTAKYTPLSSSKVEFGINKTNSNQNQNNNNDSNMSDSIDKSSEQGFPSFAVNNEADNIIQPLSNNDNVKFGFVENKNDINKTPQKTNNLKLEDHNIKFGFIQNEQPKKENKIIVKEDNKGENMEVEPGEIVDNENGEIKGDNIEIIIKEKNEEINQNKKDDKKDDIKKEDNKKEEKEDKEKEKEEEKIKPESYFQKSLFNNNENMQVEGSSLFNQKLFQNDTNHNNNNQPTNSKSLFPGLFTNNNFSLNFNSPNNSQKIEENFFTKNKISSSLTNSNKENLFGEEGQKSGTFTLFSQESKNSINDESNKENEKKPTLGDIIREGGVFNADSEKNTEKENNQIKESTKDNTKAAFSFPSFGESSNNKTNVSPFTDYINDNKGKNFITGDNKENKNNIGNNSLFSFNNSSNSFNINSNSTNPFAKVIGETNNNNKSVVNSLGNKPEQKIENKNLFSSIVTTKSYELEKPKNEENNPDKKTEEKKSIFSTCSSNFFNAKKDQKPLDNENKSSSSLFPGLPFDKNKSEINIGGKPSSLFPGLNSQILIDQNVNKASSSLFPGLNNNNSINIFGSDDNKSKPLFPGGSSANKTLNIFGDNKEFSNDKKEEKKDENEFRLFNSQTKIENKNEKSDTESISLGGSNPKTTATSIYILRNGSNQIKNDDEKDTNKNENETEINAIKSDRPLLNNIITAENDENKNEDIKPDNNNEKKEEENDEQSMEIDNIEINLKRNLTESITQGTQEDKNKNKKNVLLSDIIISKKEDEEKNKQKTNDGSLLGKDFINNDKKNGGNSLFNTNLVEKVKNDESTTQKKPAIKSLFGGLFQNENNKGFESLFSNNNSNSNLFDDNNNKHASIFSDNNNNSIFGNNSGGLFGNSGGLFGDTKNTNTGFFEGLKNNDENENEKEDKDDKKNEKENNVTETKENKENKENKVNSEIKDSKEKIEIKFNKDNGGLFGSDNFGGLFANQKNNNDENNENGNKDKDKDINESANLFGNNNGKSIFGGFSGINTSSNLNILGTETTPIKASTLFKKEIEKEKKEKEKKEIIYKNEGRIKEYGKQIEFELFNSKNYESKKEEEEENEYDQNENVEETEKVEENEKDDQNRKENENENMEEIEKDEEEEKDDDKIGNENVEETEKEEHKKEEEEENEEEGEGEGEGEDNRGIFNGETLVKQNSESESEKNDQNEKNSKLKEDQEEIEKEEESEEEEKEKESDIELSIEEEYNSSQNIQNKSSSSDIKDSNNSNMKIISRELTVRKPVSRQMYSDLIQKLYEITDERQNRINLKEEYAVTIYKNTLDKYLKNLEDLIIEMKQKYILTLIKKHFEKDPNKKKQIIIEANIPKIRNNVKRTFKELIIFIKNNLELPNRKYYYLQILNILNKYEVIGEDEIQKMIKLNKKNRLNNGIVDGKVSKKGNKNGLKKYNDKEKESWIMAKKSNGISFKIFTFVIPLFYIANYIYANFKD